MNLKGDWTNRTHSEWTNQIFLLPLEAVGHILRLLIGGVPRRVTDPSHAVVFGKTLAKVGRVVFSKIL